MLVHGALSHGAHWLPVAESLSDSCTCWVMDRWGRGASGEHSGYHLDREVEDVSAVLEAAGPGAALLGHSSGAIYALEVARRSPPAALILYEPPIHGFHGRFVREVWDRIQVAARAGRFEDVVTIFLRDEAEVPPMVLTALRDRPLWRERVATAPQAVREWEALIRADPAVERYGGIRVPTLLLGGERTARHPSFATRALASAMPDARVELLAGQGHTAHLVEPAMVAGRVAEFLEERAP